MLTVGQKIPNFSVLAVKPGFNHPVENGVSAFEVITEESFYGKWKVLYFYPKDFTSVCPTEIIGFADLNEEFSDRDTIVLGGSADNEFVKLAWRRDHKDLSALNQYSFADINGKLAAGLGVQDNLSGLSLRATFIIDPNNFIQHASVNGLNVGRNPQEILRILDALQTNELCACNRPVGGETIE